MLVNRTTSFIFKVEDDHFVPNFRVQRIMMLEKNTDDVLVEDLVKGQKSPVQDPQTFIFPIENDAEIADYLLVYSVFRPVITMFVLLFLSASLLLNFIFKK